jgi:hypothetical protein
MSIEESGLGNVESCEDVPGWRRLSNVSLVFYPIEPRATLTFSRLRYEHSVTRQTTEEIVEW